MKKKIKDLTFEEIISIHNLSFCNECPLKDNNGSCIRTGLTYDFSKEFLEKEIDIAGTTLSECIKEWEERGWEFIDKDGFICFRTKIDNREKDTIIISKEDNEIYFNSKEFNYDLEYEETALCLSFELYNLLTKTLKALEKTKDE